MDIWLLDVMLLPTKCTRMLSTLLATPSSGIAGSRVNLRHRQTVSTAAALAGGGCALGASREGLPAARPRPPPLCPEPRDRATAGPAGPRPARPRGALPSPGAQPRSPVTLPFLRIRTRPGAPVDVTVNHHVTVTCHRAQGLSRLLFPFSDRALGPAPHALPAWPRAVSPVRTALAGPEPARKGRSDPGRGGAA